MEWFSKFWCGALLMGLELCVAVGATLALLSPRLATLGAAWFDSVCLPGLVLFPLVSAMGRLRRLPWATSASLGVGVLLLLWEGAQLAMTSPVDHVVLLVAGLLGASITALALLLRGLEVREVKALRWAVSR